MYLSIFNTIYQTERRTRHFGNSNDRTAPLPHGHGGTDQTLHQIRQPRDGAATPRQRLALPPLGNDTTGFTSPTALYSDSYGYATARHDNATATPRDTNSDSPATPRPPHGTRLDSPPRNGTLPPREPCEATATQRHATATCTGGATRLPVRPQRRRHKPLDEVEFLRVTPSEWGFILNGKLASTSHPGIGLRCAMGFTTLSQPSAGNAGPDSIQHYQRRLER